MATRNFFDDYLYEDSDQEGGSDSEDEIKTWLDGTPKQKRHIRRRDLGQPSDSSEDEFEKEMNAELSNTIKEQFSFGSQASSSLVGNPDKAKEEENDKLLYDPAMDDEDQKWIDSQRRKYHVPTNGHQETAGSQVDDRTKPLPKSDAVLNCPACMCAVCLDCQRHEKHTNQYRAMFVMNCLVHYGETLKFKKDKKQKKNRKRKATGAAAEITDSTDISEMVNIEPQVPGDDNSNEDTYHPVTCSNCNTRIAVYDSDEVYHFFNVIASYS